MKVYLAIESYPYEGDDGKDSRVFSTKEAADAFVGQRPRGEHWAVYEKELLSE